MLRGHLFNGKAFIAMLFNSLKDLCRIAIMLLVFSPAWAANPPVEKLKICLMDTQLFPLWRAPGREELQDPGLNIELMNIILTNMNLRADWVRAPFLRCLALLQSGEVDIINAASYQADREQYGRYPFTEGALDPGKRLKFDTYYLMISHQFYARNTELSEQIWAESQALQQNEYSKLLYKYDTMLLWSEGQN